MEDINFLKKLSKYGLLKEYLKSKILEDKIKNINLNEEEILTSKESYMKFFSLNDEKSLENHRILNLMSTENLFYKITLYAKVQKYCEIHYSDYISKSFYKQKEKIDSVTYSLIRVKEYGLIKEIYHRIKDDKDDFNLIAKNYSIGIEKQTSGIIGPLSLDKVHPEVKDKLKKCYLKFLHKPFKVNDDWVLIKLEEYFDSKLDQNYIKKIKSELLDKDIEKELISIYGEKLKSFFN